MRSYYIASCNFTAAFPKASEAIRDYVKSRHGIAPVRCCTPGYQQETFLRRMPEGALRDAWCALPETAPLAGGDLVYTPCHTCANIIGEQYPAVTVRSLWELIDGDPAFSFPQYPGLTVTVQDCWRARERAGEQDAVRSLLTKMGISFVEAAPSRREADYCGPSLYRPQPVRNASLAPRHYVEDAGSLFAPHSEEEQLRLMRDYCSRFTTDIVVCYCVNCLEGLLMGGKRGIHIADLLFPEAGEVDR